MSLTSLLRGLASRKQAATLTYKDAVARIADDRDPPVDTLEQVLLAAGKASGDLERDVARLKRRREALILIQAAADCGQLRQAASRRLAVAQAALDQAQQAFDDVAGEIDGEMHQLRAREQQAEDARRYLAESADESVQHSVREAEEGVATATRTLQAATAEVEHLEHAAKDAARRVEGVQAGRVELIGGRAYIGPAVSESDCRRNAEAIESRRRAAEKRLETARHVHQQAERQLVEARRNFLVP